MKKEYAFHSLGAVFAEVYVDADLGIISVYDVRNMLNPKTACNTQYNALTDDGTARKVIELRGLH